MDHKLFKSGDMNQGIHSVVGDCNGIPANERWEKETPLFAAAINKLLKGNDVSVLDYGCGVGRLAKGLLDINSAITVIGVDDSANQLSLAEKYINTNRFIPMFPHELDQKVDLAYCVYVLQHVPAIELRTAIQRLFNFLKDDGILVYCSSDYRMAIRFDQGGFFDDRFLGVNIREEIGRYFTEVSDLFDAQAYQSHPILSKMVEGKDGLPHPAKIFRKKRIAGHLFNADCSDEKIVHITSDKTKETNKKIILRNRMSPGDILVMTVALRALHKAHGDKFQIDIDTPVNEIFQNSPYITKLNGDGQVIDMQYPEIHKSGASGRHFVDGHRKFLEERLELTIPRVGLLPDIFLTQDEKLWPSPVFNHVDRTKYWVINAGSKSDYTLKQYHRWQEVVDILQDREFKVVQIGVEEHNHPALKGVIDMRGHTNNHRHLYRTIYHADGVLTCVSYPMHIAAAFQKPCVVVAGGREGTRWELYPNHRFLYMNGVMSCAIYDGCWKSKIEECLQPAQPVDMQSKVPLCLDLIRPEDVARAVDLYYLGGAIKSEVSVV